MSWQRVRGHDAQVRLFTEARRRGRLAHAYIFIGPAGIGKRLFAGELAKALLCEGAAPDRLEACDRCAACTLVEAGTHPDFFAVAPPPDAPNMPIDTVRALCGNLALKPMRGHGKVAVIDDADAFDDPITSHAAANAFLKTLEEPPPRSLLILIGSSADRQLPTIRSRCQVVRFAPLPADVVADLLRAQGITDAALIERLVRLSGGSPGEALELADPALWEFRRTLLKGLTQPRPDSVALAKQWSAFAEEAGKEGAAQRRRAALALRLLIDLLDDAVRLSLEGTPRVAAPDEVKPLQELASRLGSDRLLELLERCLEADVHIDRRVQLVLVLEALTDALGRA